MVESILTWWRIVCTWGWCSWGYCYYRWRHSASNSYIQGMRRQFLLWTTPCKTHYSVVAYTMLYYQTLGLKSFWSRMLVLLLLIFHKKKCIAIWFWNFVWMVFTCMSKWGQRKTLNPLCIKTRRREAAIARSESHISCWRAVVVTLCTMPPQSDK